MRRTRETSGFVLVAAICLGMLTWLAPAVDGQMAVPAPNAGGDYFTRLSHRVWEVVDPSPEGLNVRLSSHWPRDWMDAGPMRMDILSWPVIRTLPRGSIFIANNSPAGFVYMTDERNLPWLKVSLDGKDRIAFVRANSQFVRPVAIGGHIAYVQAPDGFASVRSGQGKSHSIVARIPNGPPFLVVKQGEWCAVLAPNGRRGFVHRSIIRIAEPVR